MKTILFLIISFFYLLSCNMNSSNIEKHSIDSLVVYNYDFNPEKSSIMLDDSLYLLLVNPDSTETDLIIASFINNAIVFLSPSKDTIRFKENYKKTGIQDIGFFKYSYPPFEGYYDMEYPNKEHYYFIKFSNGFYGRFYIIDYNFDSIICNIEILLKGDSFD